MSRTVELLIWSWSWPTSW